MIHAGASILILHLENEAGDGERVHEVLIAEGIDCRIDRVSTREDFAAALSRDYDVILAAHMVPDFDGEAALAMSREKAPHIPFVFVSATWGMDVAVEALKHGATDYVVKQRLERLPAVIRRALGERAERVARRAVEDALRLSEDSFVAFANAAPLLCWMAEPDGAIRWYNQRWYDYTGTDLAQMNGWGWQSVHDPEILPQVIRTWQRSIESHAAWEMTFPLRGVDGSYRMFLTRAAPVKDDQGRVLRWIGVNVDVSAQIEAEQGRRAAEETLRLATRAAQVGIWDYDPVHRVLHWDEQCRALFGLRPGAPVSYEGAFLAGLHPDDREMVEAAAVAAMTPGDDGGYDIEYRAIGLEDGIERWIEAKGRGQFADGQAVRFVGTVVDITERKRAHAALAASEAALRAESDALEILNRVSREIAAELDLETLVQTVVDAGVALVGAELGAFFYTILDAQGQAYRLYALSGAERSAFENFPMPRATELFGPAFRGEGLIRLDDVLADPRYGSTGPHFGMPAGHSPVRSYLAVPVSLRSGEVVGCLFFGHAEPGRFAPRTERLVAGLAAQAAVGIENARLFQSAQRLNQTLEEQVAARTAERDRIWQVSADLLGVADNEGRWISINPAWTRLLGWEADEIIGRTGEWMRHPDDHEQTAAEARKLFAGEVTTSFENRLRTRAGDYRTFNWRAVPVDGEIYAVARDITAQVEQAAALAEAEEGLRQSQKMEALGQLTGGVAHDFNNLLQIVIGNLDMLKRNLPDDAPRLRRAADNASAGAERAATLTQRLLAFARRQPLAPSPVAPDRLVEGMTELLHRTLGETIRVETAFDTDEWLVEVDPNQLESALLNLAINARDAMREGGTLIIEVEHLSLDTPILGQSEVPAGDHVVIAVSDSGEGMAPGVVARVFEPFFTTKEVGKGTGLGLSMVYGFVKQSGGHVHIASQAGEGTTVRIYLPRLLACGTAVASVPETGERSGGGSETILVCEDDDGVRANSVESLRELGYAVLEAADARAALVLLDGCDSVDLLFTDVILPGGMTGSDLAVQARARCPDLRVLFTSGYARDAIVHHGRLDPGVELLPKPFSFEELALRVRRMLDA